MTPRILTLTRLGHFSRLSCGRQTIFQFWVGLLQSLKYYREDLKILQILCTIKIYRP